MKKMFAVFLAAVLLLCMCTPLCSACAGTRNASVTFVPGIGFTWTYPAEPDTGENGSGETRDRQSAGLLSAVRRILADSGTFTFTAYGRGHGVGMSQLGAVEYGRQGRSYDWILRHYYPGVSLLRETPPDVVTYDGKTRDTEDFLIRAVQQEIGGAANAEAYKAQAVAVYSILKSGNYSLTAGDVSCSASADYRLSSAVRSAVRSVLGQYLSYGGETVNAVFFACSAGKTTDSKSVWGVKVPYLNGGVDSPETVSVSVSVVTAKGLKRMVRRYNAAHPEKTITLSGDPAQWLEIVSCDGARGDTGYVTSIRVGSMTMSGHAFRTMYNMYRPSGTAALNSHCFSVRFS